MKKTILWLMSALLFLGGAGIMNPSAAASEDILKVGVRENLYNFSYYHEDAGAYYGFEDDLARKIADELGYDKVRFVGLMPEEREAALDSGKVDCIIAAYSRTPSRARKYDLSKAYYHDYGRVIVKKSTLFTDLSDLKGCTLGIRKGTDVKELFTSRLRKDGLIKQNQKYTAFVKLKEYNTYDQLRKALETGKVDGACADGCIAASWMMDDIRYLGEPYSREYYTVATPKGSSLSSDINQTVISLKKDGTIRKLAEKWDIYHSAKAGGRK